MPPSGFRSVRSDSDQSCRSESSLRSERAPFLTQQQSFAVAPALEDGLPADPDAREHSESHKLATFEYSDLDNDVASGDDASPPHPSKRRRSWNFISFKHPFRRPSRTSVEKARPARSRSYHKSPLSTPLRRVVRLLAIALMLLGIVEFIVLACGLLTAFFPDDLDDSLDQVRPSGLLAPALGRWPSDFTADIRPVACHSHNDYWRKEPLYSALNAGCTGVEADVWLFDDDLFVGHSKKSLTPERTLRNLYIDPLMKILSSQNTITSFHPTDDVPKNGVFDTDPSQTLVLLIDFKTDGNTLWQHVSDQLQPLRENNYLTHFNGSSVVQGPITVVVTGNAPFNAVVANPHYRDLFFDAPLDLMEKLIDGSAKADLPDSSEPSDGSQGQDPANAAPTNPAIYSPANSYYASVDFKRTIGFPWRGHLSPAQLDKLRKQIAGAHSRGLKVRYWAVPGWPRGLRYYLWRVLVREGVDYLNVDDLQSATKGTWGWGKKGPWWSSGWRFWPSGP